jgi:phosphatidylinositol glycan class B
LTSYRDQTDVFYESPYHYFHHYFPSDVDPSFPPSSWPTSIPGEAVSSSHGPLPAFPWAHEWPQYLVLFGALLKENGVRKTLEEKGYKEVWRKGREWEGEGNRKGGVRVWKWSRR